MLVVRDLEVSVGEVPILRGINLEVKAGEVHAVMGPNGSGKSTLAQVLAGRDVYSVTRGEVLFEGMDFLEMVSNKMKLLSLDQSLRDRPVNAGFSGGEKKRNEIFQMAVLEPKLAILDETDSGLDIDALKIVANGVN